MAGLFFFFFSLIATHHELLLSRMSELLKLSMNGFKKKLQVNFNPPSYHWHMFLITIALKHEYFFAL